MNKVSSDFMGRSPLRYVNKFGRGHSGSGDGF